MTQKPRKRATAAEKREGALLAKVAELTAGNQTLRASFNEIHNSYHAMANRNEEQEKLLRERTSEIRKLKDDEGRSAKTLGLTKGQLERVKGQRDMWQGAMFATDAVKAKHMLNALAPPIVTEDGWGV